MRKETITYEDYNGVTRTEDFYFGFNKAELMEMELGTPGGGMRDKLQKIVDSPDASKISTTFKEILLASYGEKSEDGKRFVKSPELSKAFSETMAYSDLWMKLSTEEGYASEFIRDIMPKDLIDELDKRQQNGEIIGLPTAE